MRSPILIGASLAAALIVAAPAGSQTTVSQAPGSQSAGSQSGNRGDQSGGVTLTAPPVTGQAVYTQVCQACHMANAMGGTGAATIPALAGNPRLQVAEYPINMVVHGRGAMPYFTDMLSPGQVAAVVTYVRTHFGNHYEKPVTEGEVKALWVPAPKPER